MPNRAITLSMVDLSARVVAQELEHHPDPPQASGEETQDQISHEPEKAVLLAHSCSFQ